MTNNHNSTDINTNAQSPMSFMPSMINIWRLILHVVLFLVYRINYISLSKKFTFITI